VFYVVFLLSFVPGWHLEHGVRTGRGLA